MYVEFHNLLLCFYEVCSASEAKITGKGIKYQGESYIVLLLSETVLYWLCYVVMFHGAQYRIAPNLRGQIFS